MRLQVSRETARRSERHRSRPWRVACFSLKSSSPDPQGPRSGAVYDSARLSMEYVVRRRHPFGPPQARPSKLNVAVRDPSPAPSLAVHEGSDYGHGSGRRPLREIRPETRAFVGRSGKCLILPSSSVAETYSASPIASVNFPAATTAQRRSAVISRHMTSDSVINCIRCAVTLAGSTKPSLVGP